MTSADFLLWELLLCQYLLILQTFQALHYRAGYVSASSFLEVFLNEEIGVHSFFQRELGTVQKWPRRKTDLLLTF